MVFLNLIIPFVMMLVGYMLRKHPISDMSSHNGYSTPTSRKSQRHWDYAQNIAPDIYTSLGKTLLLLELGISLFLWVLKIKETNSVIVGMGVGFAFLWFSFYTIDNKILEKFDED